METINYNTTGGPLVVEITAGHAQTGSYEFRLWEANQNRIVMKRDGDFMNSEDDAYELPTPNSINRGRRVQAMIVLALIPPSNKFSAALKVSQDGNQLGEVTIEGESDEPSVVLNLYGVLDAEATG